MPKIPDMNQIMKMAQNMSNSMKEKMDNLEVTGNAGGGMVKVVMNGHKNLLKISIEDEVIDPREKEMLNDLIIAAVNDAIRKVDEELKGEMGGMLPPGMGGGLPF